MDMSLPHKKYNLYDPETGHVSGMKSEWFDADHKPTICNCHIILANNIRNHVADPEIRDGLLRQLDIVYDMGKRMGNKMLADYKKSGKKSGWREGY